MTTHGPGTERQKQHRLVFANHLRGLAALSVVLAHMIAVYWGPRELVSAYTATPDQLGPPSSLYPFICRSWLNLGPLGVATFFLISGLVVPISLAHHSRLTFLGARALRIYPVFIAGALIALCAVRLNGLFWDLPFPPDFDPRVIWGTLLLVPDLLGVTDFTLVCWTLSIELRFYLLVALVIPAIRRGDTRWIVAVAGSAFAAHCLWNVGIVQDYAANWPQIVSVVMDLNYIVFMLIGVLFNYHLRGLLTTPRFGAGVMVLSAVFAIDEYIGPLKGEFPITPANYGYALVAFSLFYAARRWIKPFKPLDALAAVSYPLYASHSIVGYSLLKLFILQFGIGYRYALVLTLAGVLTLATGLHLTVERWSIVRGKRLARRPAAPLVAPTAPILQEA